MKFDIGEVIRIRKNAKVSFLHMKKFRGALGHIIAQRETITLVQFKGSGVSNDEEFWFKTSSLLKCSDIEIYLYNICGHDGLIINKVR